MFVNSLENSALDFFKVFDKFVVLRCTYTDTIIIMELYNNAKFAIQGEFIMEFRDILSKLSGTQEQQWSQGTGDNQEGWQKNTPSENKTALPKISKLWLIVGGLFILFTIILPSITVFLTDMYWFESQGFSSVFWRRLIAKWELFGVALVPAFLIFWGNWHFAVKNSLSLYDEPGIKKAEVSIIRITFGIAVVMALVNAFGSMGSWGTFLKFIHPTQFGEVDPLFGKDIGFYVFTLPFFQFIQTWLQGVLTLSLIGVFFTYFFTHAISLNGRTVIAPSKVRLHLALLVALTLLTWGAGYWISRYDLLFSPTGVVYGAGYTDVHILLPAFMILTIAAVVAAILLMLNLFKPMWKLSMIIVFGLLVFGFVARTFVPGLIQQYRVKPNEYEMEKPFLGYHLDYTRRAFKLNDVTVLSVTPEPEVTAEELKANQETVQNIRMWDYAPLLRTYRQLQAIRTYYDFNDVYIDRYEIGGVNRQVMLSVRELDLTKFQNPTWVNTHLEFTHGYGVVMNPVNEIAPGGLPNFFMKDLPSRSIPDIPLNRPEIYFGTATDSYVLVKTDVKEFDYPREDSNVRSSYQGQGGVEIGSMWRRLLFAMRFRDTEIIFTGALNSESKIIFNQNVRKALSQVAPFLIYDEDAYPVIYKGRIIWVQDAFTWSTRYPYSKPINTADKTLAHFNGVNYIRNSVKATVDAYDGSMKFYIVDDKDPLIQTWNKIFPGLFKPGNEMSKELWKHMRYPENLFEVQSDVYRTFHMTDTNTYYNREDVWDVTPSGSDSRINPNYVTMKLLGEKHTEFAIIVPYMPLGRDNLIGWMAGRCDPENYGQLLVYKFPKQKLIYGPTQIEALINQNPEISSQLSLWSQRGSDVIRGDLLVIPVGKSLLYVQPLYLKAEKGELPELKRVIVSTGGRVEWAETFAKALEKLIGVKGVADIGSKKAIDSEKQSAIVNKYSSGATPEVVSLAKRAQNLYESALNAQRNGDWSLYGSEIKKLGEVLSQLEEGAK